MAKKRCSPAGLYETTRFAAARLLRTNARRRAREQEAYMQSTLNEADPAAVWEKLSPHLEAAMSRLAERDRALLVLRFYENKSGPEAAALLGIREDAAHKRVTRAIEKLRKFFCQTRNCFNGGDHCRNDFRQFRSSRARDAGKICNCRGDCQRRGGQRLNLNPHQRSIENYGVGKSKNCSRGRYRTYFGCGYNNSRSSPSLRWHTDGFS